MFNLFEVVHIVRYGFTLNLTITGFSSFQSVNETVAVAVPVAEFLGTRTGPPKK